MARQRARSATSAWASRANTAAAGLASSTTTGARGHASGLAASAGPQVWLLLKRQSAIMGRFLRLC